MTNTKLTNETPETDEDWFELEEEDSEFDHELDDDANTAQIDSDERFEEKIKKNKSSSKPIIYGVAAATIIFLGYIMLFSGSDSLQQGTETETAKEGNTAAENKIPGFREEIEPEPAIKKSELLPENTDKNLALEENVSQPVPQNNNAQNVENAQKSLPSADVLTPMPSTEDTGLVDLPRLDVPELIDHSADQKLNTAESSVPALGIVAPKILDADVMKPAEAEAFSLSDELEILDENYLEVYDRAENATVNILDSANEEILSQKTEVAPVTEITNLEQPKDVKVDKIDNIVKQETMTPISPDPVSTSIKSKVQELVQENKTVEEKAVVPEISTEDEITKTEDSTLSAKKEIQQAPEKVTKVVIAEETAKQPKEPVKAKDINKLKNTNESKVSNNWKLRSARQGSAVLYDNKTGNMQTVEIGDSVKGLGKIKSIDMKNGKWLVQGTIGTVSQ